MNAYQEFILIIIVKFIKNMKINVNNVIQDITYQELKTQKFNAFHIQQEIITVFIMNYKKILWYVLNVRMNIIYIKVSVKKLLLWLIIVFITLVTRNVINAKMDIS